MIKTMSLTVALALAGAALPAGAQTPPPPPPAAAKMQAKPYVTAAAKSDMYEIESSKLALQKSQNPAVKRFAQMMIDHHQKTTAATMAAARKAGMTPPPPPPMDPRTTASMNELKSASGANFDRMYLGQQVPAHQAALDLHKSYAANGDQAALRASAKAAVPIVQQHLTAAQALHKTVHAGHAGM